MSICAQAKAARRKARIDPRYASRKRKDVSVRTRRLQEQIARERKIAQGKKK